jgi:acetoin utilization protein AcuB
MKYDYVRDWMTKAPVSVKTTDTLPEAHALMKSKGIRRLPVVDNDDKVIGILTLGDLREAKASSATTLSVWELNYLLNDLKVKNFMTPDPIVAKPDMTIGDAAALMLMNKLGGLPVVDDQQKLVGIITESDIFELVVLHEWQAIEDGVAFN